MPAYNAQSFLGQAMESILSQDFDDFELIVLNDGSTDKTEEIIDSFPDPRIVKINQEHCGIPNTRNIGLRLAKGELVANLDADDISTSNRLAVQVDFLDAYQDITLVGSWITLIDERGKTIKTYSYPCQHDELVRLLNKGLNPLPHSTVMFRKQAVLDIGGYNGLFAQSEDYELYLRMSEVREYRFASIPHCLCYLRYSSSSMSHKNTEQRKYHLFATLITEMRRNYGFDLCKSGDSNHLLAEFGRWYYTSAQVNYARASQYRKKALLAYTNKDWRHSVAMALMSLRFDPLWIFRKWSTRDTKKKQLLRWWTLRTKKPELLQGS
jgi:glycosyltransferase involved in cell wall biosynthesis